MKKEEVILLKDVLKDMDSGEPFSMTYITANRKKGTGGEIKHVKGWAKSSQPRTSPVVQSKRKTVISQLLTKKNPHHFENKTRNIRNLKRLHEIKKIHIRLIVEYNGKKVV